MPKGNEILEGNEQRSGQELPTIPVRIPRGLVRQVDVLVEQGIFASRSQGCVALITAGLTHLPEISRAKVAGGGISDLHQMRSPLDYWEAFGGAQSTVEFMTKATEHEPPWSDDEINVAVKDYATNINQVYRRAYSPKEILKIGEQLADYIRWDLKRASPP